MEDQKAYPSHFDHRGLLGGAALAVIILTFNGTIGHTTGFIALAVIIFVKIGLNILMNAVLK